MVWYKHSVYALTIIGCLAGQEARCAFPSVSGSMCFGMIGGAMSLLMNSAVTSEETRLFILRSLLQYGKWGVIECVSDMSPCVPYKEKFNSHINRNRVWLQSNVGEDAKGYVLRMGLYYLSNYAMEKKLFSGSMMEMVKTVCRQLGFGQDSSSIIVTTLYGVVRTPVLLFVGKALLPEKWALELMSISPWNPRLSVRDLQQ